MAKINFKKVQDRVMSAAGLVAGSVAGSYAGTAIDKIAPGKITPVMNAGARILLGAVLPSFVGGGKKEGFINDFANGMMAQGGVALAKVMNIPGVSGTELDSPIAGYVAGEGGYVSGTDVGMPVSGTTN